MAKPRVKICCIASVEEANLAIKYGASALGLVSEMPSGPGVISLEEIAEIVQKIPPPIATFLLTCKQTVEEIVAQHWQCLTNTIQICDTLLDENYDKLKTALPTVKIVQVIHVADEDSIKEAMRISEKVMRFCLIREVKPSSSKNSAEQAERMIGQLAEKLWMRLKYLFF